MINFTSCPLLQAAVTPEPTMELCVAPPPKGLTVINGDSAVAALLILMAPSISYSVYILKVRQTWLRLMSV